DRVNVIDQMGTALSLRPETVRVEDSNGVAITGWTYDYDIENHKAIFTIPDNQHLIIKYSATLDEAVGTYLGNRPDSEVGNSVTIEGYTSDKTSDSAKLNSSVMQSAGIGYGQTSSITLYKYNSNISNALGGATFRIDMITYDDATGTITPAEPGSGENAVPGGVTGYEGPKFVTTLADGTTTVDGLLHDKIYRITETVAPSGYKKADAYYFLIEGDDHATLPAALTPNSAFKTAGQIVYIEDETGDDEEVAFDFKKTNNTSVAVPGAVYKFYKETSTAGTYETTEALSITTATVNTVINVLKSTDTAGTFTNELYAGTYKLVEESAPAGYSLAAPLKVVIKEDGEVTVSKIDGTDTTKADVSFVEKTKADSTTYKYYTLNVTNDSVSAKFEKKVSSNGSVVDETPGHFLNGAELSLSYIDPVTNAEVSKTIASTTDDAVEVRDLLRNVEYTLKETTVPTGYNKAEDIKFIINNDGSISALSGTTGSLSSITNDTAPGDKTHIITMVDTIEEKDITFSKTDINGNPLNGAELKIYLASDTTHAGSYISIGSETEASKVVKVRIDGNLAANTLKYGEKYVLVEQKAPVGYAYSEDIEFEISGEGELVVNGVTQATAELVMADKPYEVSFGKYSRATNQRLAGAKFKITDENNSSTVVKEWTSTETSDEVISGTKFVIGHKYKLTETAIPNGDGNAYIQMKDVYFKIGKDGRAAFITDGNPCTEPSRIGADISMTDTSDTQTIASSMTIYNEVTVPGNFLISKRVASGTSYGADELQGAVFKLYKANDAYVKTGEPIDSWTTGTARSFWVFDTQDDLNNDVTAHATRSGTRIVKGKYVLVEESAPVGFVKESTNEYPMEIDVDGYPDDNNANALVGIVSVNYHGSKPSFKDVPGLVSVVSGGTSYTNENIVITNAPKKLSFAKYDSDGTSPLSGAALELQKSTDGGVTWNTVPGEHWSTDGTPHTVDMADLGQGEFRLVETASPAGYSIAKPVEFKITSENQGSVYLKENGSYKANPESEVDGVISLSMTDGKLSLSVKKTGEGDIALTGVKYKIVDAATDAE
ncbi:MAG: hypothetical protein J5962_05300, partial [Lachnospiraceae bacterium]|nr:hypothetical protein [Lachnospiraceae bacterium]